MSACLSWKQTKENSLGVLDLNPYYLFFASLFQCCLCNLRLFSFPALYLYRPFYPHSDCAIIPKRYQNCHSKGALRATKNDIVTQSHYETIIPAYPTTAE